MLVACGTAKSVGCRCTWDGEGKVGMATWTAPSWSGRRAVEQQSTNLVHSCVILLLVVVEIVVEVISCVLLGESQVGGEVVDAFIHCLLLLMPSTLRTKDVDLSDVGVHVIVVLNEEWVGRSTWPIHHSKTNVSGRKRRTSTKCTLTEVESGSRITPM